MKAVGAWWPECPTTPTTPAPGGLHDDDRRRGHPPHCRPGPGQVQVCRLCRHKRMTGTKGQRGGPGRWGARGETQAAETEESSATERRGPATERGKAPRERRTGAFIPRPTLSPG